ncbi:hypothetical protein [Campylobacter avium]|uniref:hypothetical protein n=1 Tax=Campylobacter avium TaxID=522485 RepID=UPI0023569D15|nr:hypothetical protein [Campylobacter avium]
MIKAIKMRKKVNDIKHTSFYDKMNHFSNHTIISSGLFFVTLLTAPYFYYIYHKDSLFYILIMVVFGFSASLSAMKIGNEIENKRDVMLGRLRIYKRENAEFLLEKAKEIEKELDDIEEVFSYYTSRAKIYSRLYVCSFFIIVILNGKV